MAEETAKTLKACIVAHKGGLPQGELDDEYFKFTGSYIPYLRLGYTSLYEYMGTFTDIVKERNDEQILCYKVLDPDTAHIASMVEKQKDPFSGTRFTRTNPRPINKVAPRENGNSKRKAVNDPRQSRRMKKKQKSDSRLRDWNQMYDPVSSDGDENQDDYHFNISDYERWTEEEYNHPVKIMERSQKLDTCFEPIVGGKMLIGDDFFLQLAIRNVGSQIWRRAPKTALHTGLCISGQSIKECTRTLSKVRVLANRVVIMLGAEDIYRGRNAKDMITDMEDLLDCLENDFSLSRSAITLCTLPPLANLSKECHRKELATLRTFNNWIREQVHFSFHSDHWYDGNRYNIIEFFRHNTNAQAATAYDYFQMDARMVSGSSHPYVLWNLRGRRLAMNLIRSGC